ncbi:hypothetical protein [Vulcanisaeta sp. JCM 16161]|uniref:hypothetical protein n=1 Tax=Vulcanisaeta sp. JCM 16161 TaxID=1295372 RepID=UPI000AD4398A|nr:hypothetical protein [Vulcanisaeta sp. JCM 16161]
MIATNVWTPKLLPQLNLPIKNIIERVIRVEMGRSLPNVFDYVNNFYIRPELQLWFNGPTIPTRGCLARPR